MSGSAAIFDLAPGRYQMTWRLQTNPDEYSDELFLWNGALTSLASSSEADQWHEDGSNRTVTEWCTTEFQSVGVPEPSIIGGLIVAGFALIRRGRVAR